MAIQLNRTYRFKFYLNANHYIIINGVEGEIHPHTWEFTIDIMLNNEEFVQFNVYERAISKYLDKFQNKVMNDFEPFDTLVPTLENMSEVFILDIKNIVEENSGKLIKMESSETPTRSYIIGFEEDEDFKETMRNRRKQSIEDEIESVSDMIASKKDEAKG